MDSPDLAPFVAEPNRSGDHFLWRPSTSGDAGRQGSLLPQMELVCDPRPIMKIRLRISNASAAFLPCRFKLTKRPTVPGELCEVTKLCLSLRNPRCGALMLIGVPQGLVGHPRQTRLGAPATRRGSPHRVRRVVSGVGQAFSTRLWLSS